jgi:ATP-dependent DNA helicase RecQ
MNQHEILKQYFGHVSFREGQSELIGHVLARRDVFGIMPTGAGKSVCYQVPAMMMDGITLVISPLISLMKDQVNALVQSGIKAAYLNSSLNAGQYTKVMTNARQGSYKIIYVAPERLLVEEFLQFAADATISMVTIDEAHCVSQWGQDFRPSYLKILEFIDRLPKRPVISAFTATATAEVREDIIRILRLQNPFVITTGFDRKNLTFEVQTPGSKLPALMEILKRNKGKSGIIYCSTRKAVESVCEMLNRKGMSATQYHAGLSNAERHANQDDFLFDRCTLMVATNAFGMGIDKSNVSFVVHYNMPKNLESYYQEAGRAGRDGEPAECVLLYSAQDVRTNQFLIESNRETDSETTPEMQQALIMKDKERLKAMTFYCATTDCLRTYILKYFGENSPNFCGNCSNCNTNFETTDITIEAQKILSCVVRISQRNRSFGKVMIVDILRGADNERIRQSGLSDLSTFGIMADVSVHRIRTIMDHLILNGYMALSLGEYPVVNPTEICGEILREKKYLEMKLPKDVDPSESKSKIASTSKSKLKSKTKSKSKSSKDTAVEREEDLFSVLKELRKQLATAAGVPAFVIFTDATLHDMCGKLPQTLDEFLDVSGVGKAKAEKYGKLFTETIATHLSSAE